MKNKEMQVFVDGGARSGVWGASRTMDSEERERHSKREGTSKQVTGNVSFYTLAEKRKGVERNSKFVTNVIGCVGQKEQKLFKR